MAAFSRFLAKEKKTEVEELFSDIQEESKLFEEFLRLHGEKIADVKKIVPQWKEGNIDSLEIVAQEILILNGKLWTLLNEIFQLEKKERALFYFVVKEKMNQLDRRYAVYRQQKDLLDKRKYQQYAKELDPYFEQLFDFLKSLSKLILRQTNTIKGWGIGVSSMIAKAMIERKFFYHLLVDETSLDRKIKQHLTLIIRTINQILGYEKRFGLQTKEVISDGKSREVITSGIIFHEIKDPDSMTFEKFHKVYKSIVPDDEAEAKGRLQTYISYLHLKQNIRDNKTRNHLLVGIVEGKVIALSFFSTYLAQNKSGKKFFFGVVWWEVVSKEYRGKKDCKIDG